MKFQWRALRKNYNSGFYIRSGKDVGKNQINLAKGNEGKFLRKLSGAKAVPELQKPAGEWNEWHILVEGDAVTFWCNGQLAWKATGLAPAEGHIGFQAEGAPLEFRNLRNPGDQIIPGAWVSQSAGTAAACPADAAQHGGEGDDGIAGGKASRNQYRPVAPPPKIP